MRVLRIRTWLAGLMLASNLVAWGDVPDPLPHLSAAIVRASGIEEPAERARLERMLRDAAEAVKRRAGRPWSRYRLAERLHAGLHADLLRRYRAGASGIDAVLDRGEYNCVSASLLYALVARSAGLDVRLVEGPRHVFARLTLNGRQVDVQTTSPTGFDVRWDPASFRRFALAYKLATPADFRGRGLDAILDEFLERAEPVSAERALAFLWHSTGERALREGRALSASHAFLEGYRAYPALAGRSDSLAVSLARAFRLEYDAGRFDVAFEIARIENEILPDRTAVRDQLLAAALKRIDASLAAGDAVAAEEILEQTSTLVELPAEMARLEREACPRIVAEALRAGDWMRAIRMAARFAKVEPDPVESARLTDWVAERLARQRMAAGGVSERERGARRGPLPSAPPLVFFFPWIRGSEPGSEGPADSAPASEGSGEP